VDTLQAQNDADATFHFFHHRIWQGPDLLAEGLVGHSDHLTYKEIAIAGNPALALLEAKPKNSRIFNKPGRCWDDDRRWILGLIDEIGLEYQGRPKLSGLGFDARIEFYDV
jgi:hypothetical protein